MAFALFASELCFTVTLRRDFLDSFALRELTS
jgi:hypothetical protein